MKNIVTPETAKLLKAAGYPQPVLECGQVWYGLIRSSEAYNTIRPHWNIKDCWVDMFGNCHMAETFPKWGVYAPTVAELLSAAGGSLSQYVTGEWLWRGDAGGYELGRSLPELLANVWINRAAQQ